MQACGNPFTGAVSNRLFDRRGTLAGGIDAWVSAGLAVDVS
jgi:hypothetical protein